MPQGRTRWSRLGWAVAALVAVPLAALPHGDVNPQPVDTKGLEPLGETWRTTNPYRGNKKAIEIGKSAYNQQCARCHGIGGESGGLAPDLRSLDKGDSGDKDYLPPTRKGVFRDLASRHAAHTCKPAHEIARQFWYVFPSLS